MRHYFQRLPRTRSLSATTEMWTSLGNWEWCNLYSSWDLDTVQLQRSVLQRVSIVVLHHYCPIWCQAYRHRQKFWTYDALHLTWISIGNSYRWSKYGCLLRDINGDGLLGKSVGSLGDFDRVDFPVLTLFLCGLCNYRSTTTHVDVEKVRGRRSVSRDLLATCILVCPTSLASHALTSTIWLSGFTFGNNGSL